MFVALNRSLKCRHKSYRVYCRNENVHNYLYLIDPYNIDNRRSFETWVLRSSTMDDHHLMRCAGDRSMSPLYYAEDRGGIISS
jgi:hypothetical protein